MMHTRGPASISENSNHAPTDFDTKHGANRQIADFGIHGQPIQNVQKISSYAKPIHAVNYSH